MQAIWMIKKKQVQIIKFHLFSHKELVVKNAQKLGNFGLSLKIVFTDSGWFSEWGYGLCAQLVQLKK